LPLVIIGCLHFSKKLQGQQLLDEGMDQMVNHQYAESMAKNLTVLDNFPHNLADQALFQIGVLYAQPQNPDQDYEKSLGSFNRLLGEFPESRFRNQSQLWILSIRDAIDKKRKIETLHSKNVSLGKTVEQQKNEIALLQKKIKTRENADLIMSLEKTVEEQKKEINQLLDQIEKLKRVDLGIEEKKQKILLQDENTEEKKNGKDSGS
jgi:predicted ribosome quality control (RQC) complex YloA/Tae2 family protein